MWYNLYVDSYGDCMIKGVLIDLGKTVVSNRVIDFNSGLNEVYQLTDKRISFEEYLKIHKNLFEVTFNYVRRVNNEMRITDYLIALNKLANLKSDKTIEELEDAFQKGLVDEELIVGIKDLLIFFKGKNIPVIAVSNSCVSSRALSKELEEFDVLKYFKMIISSADIYIRKPRHEIFEYAISQLKKVTGDYYIKNDEVIYIGNDYQCDVIGPKNIGMRAIWFNQNQEKDEFNLADLNINSYEELLKEFID